jgi:hypothetical protein
MDVDRIRHPLRLAKGSHQPGSGKGCAMNVIIGKVLVGAAGAAVTLGLAAPAGASPVIPQPQAVPDFAGQFVLAAYNGLCPVPGGSYDYWAYSTS